MNKLISSGKWWKYRTELNELWKCVRWPSCELQSQMLQVDTQSVECWARHHGRDSLSKIYWHVTKSYASYCTVAVVFCLLCHHCAEYESPHGFCHPTNVSLYNKLEKGNSDSVFLLLSRCLKHAQCKLCCLYNWCVTDNTALLTFSIQIMIKLHQVRGAPDTFYCILFYQKPLAEEHV